MRSTRKRSVLSVATLLPALALGGCGNSTEGGGSPTEGRYVGRLGLVSTSMPPAALTPMQVARRTVSATGSGGIGQVTVVYLDRLNDEGGIAPDAVAVAPDGAVWYSRSGQLLRVAEDDTVGILRMPSDYAPNMTPDGKGSLWLTSWSPTRGVLRLDPATNVITVFDVPEPLRRPSAIAATATGEIWLAGGDRAIVGRVAANNDVFVVAVEETPTPITIVGGGVVVAGNGSVFLSDYQQGRIGRVRGEGFEWIDLGGASRAPSGLAVGPDEAVWFVSLGRPKEVGYIGRDGALHRYGLDDMAPEGSKNGSRIAQAPDGALWFTVPERERLGRITAQGELGFLQLEENTTPRDLAFDGRGRLWFTNLSGFARVELAQ